MAKYENALGHKAKNERNTCETSELNCNGWACSLSTKKKKLKMRGPQCSLVGPLIETHVKELKDILGPNPSPNMRKINSAFTIFEWHWQSALYHLVYAS